MESHAKEEPPAKKPRMEEPNLKCIVGVKLIFDFYYHRTAFQGDSWERNYGLRKKDIKYLNLSFVRAEDVSDSPVLTEHERAAMQPYCGVRLDFFKDDIVKRSDWVYFTEDKVEVRGIEGYDRMRINVIKYNECIRESLDYNDHLDNIGDEDDDDDASLYFDDDSSECSSGGGGEDQGLMQGVDECEG